MLDLVGFQLLAQAAEVAEVTKNNTNQIWIGAALFLLATVPAYFLGVGLARALRVPDYGGKLGFIFVTIGLAALVCVYGKPKFGIDLRGGVILVYEIDQQATQVSNKQDPNQAAAIDNSELVRALNERLNPGGLNEIQIRAYGERQVEIIVPDVSAEEIEAVKRKVEKAGQLEFLIVANDPQRDEVINIVLNDRSVGRERFIKNAEGKEIGRWVRVAWDKDPKTNKPTNRLSVLRSDGYYRDAATGELLADARSLDQRALEQGALEQLMQQRGIKNVDMLMVVYPDQEYRVTGADIANAVTSTDEMNNWVVRFRMKTVGATRMGNLTSANVSDKDNGRLRFLGIVLDEELRSAPSINSRIDSSGEITGRFSRQEVEETVAVLNSGKLPAVLHKTPSSENAISPLLGQDTIEKGKISMIVSLVAVLAFMVLYYRFAGFVACAALAMNTLLVVGVMILIKAAFTLPGLAGMVLTVGMAVDANVLIYERIREEMARGAALRMAIRNGFSRAMTTIIDSNLTTIVTAVVLYVIGTEQLKGFAVTLILGIGMSMFTAIYVARVIFDIAERRRYITGLKMMDWWGKSNIDFIKWFWPTTLASILLCVVGIGAAVYRGKQLFDTDFNGGTTVEMLLAESMPEAEVRKRVADHFDVTKYDDEKVDYSVTRMDVKTGGSRPDTVYKIDTSLQQVEVLEDTLEKLFKDEKGKSLLVSNEVTVAKLSPAPVTETKEATETPATSEGDKKGKSGDVVPPDTGKKKTTDTPAEVEPSTTDDKDDTKKRDSADEPMTEEKKVDEKKTADDVPPPAVEEKNDGVKKDDSTATPDGSQVFRSDVPRDLLAQAADNEKKAATEAPADEKKADDKKADDKKVDETTPKATPADEKKAAETKTDDTKVTPADETTPGEDPAKSPPVNSVPEARTQVELTFKYPVSKVTITKVFTDQVRELSKEGKLERRTWDVESAEPNWLRDLQPVPPLADEPGETTKLPTWKFIIASTEADTKLITDTVKEHLDTATVWNSSSKIGGKVAEKTRLQAVYAVLASLLGIIAYVWFRFHRLSYGVAAVIALIHDVFVTVGLIALSTWLAPFLGFAQVEEFKISLTVVAAILTLVGYSINDTIVTFDRIREVKGKSPVLTGDMINRSINETLSRTFLTAGTTLIVVVILYFMGGSGIHGFAYSMLVGVIAGTYSSVFIAAPLLLWMADRPVPSKKEKSKVSV